MDWGRPFRATGDFARDVWRGGGGRTPWLRRVLTVIFILLGPAPVLLLLLFRFLPVPATPQMVIGLLSDDGVQYHWRESWDISPYLGRAVIGSEDQKFCSHNGFDWQSIDKAIQSHERHPKRKLRGASTLSQQAARSLFLVPWRSWVRKGLEAYLTVLMEALWPKQRILIVYLNLVDWGHGNFGAEAAAQAYFHKPASTLTASEAARLAAVLPDPDEWRAVQPGPYVARRSGTIIARMRQVARDRLDSCVRH